MQLARPTVADRRRSPPTGIADHQVADHQIADPHAADPHVASPGAHELGAKDTGDSDTNTNTTDTNGPGAEFPGPADPGADPSANPGAADPRASAPGAAHVIGSYEIRRIGPADVKAVAAYDPDGDWIAATWGGPALLAHALVSHGAFTGDRLVSVAVPFYVGTEHADIGVVTEQAHRGRGLSTACAAAVVIDIRARGLLPTWTTSPDNAASLAVAARLGFSGHREDVLYAMRVPIPT